MDWDSGFETRVLEYSHPRTREYAGFECSVLARILRGPVLAYANTGQIWNDDRRRIGLLGLDHHHALAGVVMVIDRLSQKASEWCTC